MRLLKIYNYFLLVVLICVIPNIYAQGIAVDRMSIIKKLEKEEHPSSPYYTVKINYPEFKNVNHANEINSLIQQVITKNKHDFKTNVLQSPNVPIEGLPLNASSNTLDIDYQLYTANPRFISIRFSLYTFYYGAVHPNTTFKSLNYDLQEGRELGLSDLFKTNDYLQKISHYCKRVLTQKLTEAAQSPTEEVDIAGVKPTAENFRTWNIDPNGLRITFPPYQVAAYVFGPQEVLVPYGVLQKDIKLDVWPQTSSAQ